MQTVDPDYYHDTRERLDARVAELEERAADRFAEVDFGRDLPGLSDSIAAARRDGVRFKAEAEDLARVADVVDAGYPYWERIGAEIALEHFGPSWWKSLEEAQSAGFDPIRLPLDAQRAYANAVQSKLFDRFEVCAIYETDGEFVESSSYWLLGVRDFVTIRAAPFLTAGWETTPKDTA